MIKAKTILIIEDDQDILFALSALLSGDDYKILVAENGAVALELLKNNDLPDLILLDMLMPVMNGWEFALEFAKTYDHQCPIVIMTAAADAEQRAKDINADDWIEKPFPFNKLLALIEKHINVEDDNLSYASI